MIKKLCLFALLLSLVGCATAPAPETAPAADAVPAATAEKAPLAETSADDPIKKLTEAYELLSNYLDIQARKLIDQSIQTYKGRKDLEGLATAYTVSTDYYRYVTSDVYKKNSKQWALNPSAMEPLPLYAVLSTPVTKRTKAESKLAIDTYKEVIAEAIAAKNHFKATNNYYRLAVHSFRNGQAPDGCKALNETLKQYTLAAVVNPDRPVLWNTLRYPSFPDQIVDHKKKMGCK